MKISVEVTSYPGRNSETVEISENELREITEEEIKNAIERKVRVAIADQTN